MRCSVMADRFGPCLRLSSNWSSDRARGALQAFIGCFFGRLMVMQQAVWGLSQVIVFAATAVRFSTKSSSFALFSMRSSSSAAISGFGRAMVVVFWEWSLIRPVPAQSRSSVIASAAARLSSNGPERAIRRRRARGAGNVGGTDDR